MIIPLAHSMTRHSFRQRQKWFHIHPVTMKSSPKIMIQIIITMIKIAQCITPDRNGIGTFPLIPEAFPANRHKVFQENIIPFQI